MHDWVLRNNRLDDWYQWRCSKCGTTSSTQHEETIPDPNRYISVVYPGYHRQTTDANSSQPYALLTCEEFTIYQIESFYEIGSA